MGNIDISNFKPGFNIKIDLYENWVKYNPVINRYAIAFAIDIPYDIKVAVLSREGIDVTKINMDEVAIVKVGNGYKHYNDLRFDYSIIDK